MATIDLIYCAGGNERFYRIARDAGFLYGARLPDTVYGPLHFADQDWRAPDRERYMAAVAQHRPYMATVLDWERKEQLPEVLAWAEEIAQWVEVVGIIPKVHGGIAQLPRVIGGKLVRLCYSVPTQYAGTELMLMEFINWPIHLLGGSPGAQMEVARYLDVKSADGNYIQKLATSRCLFWQRGKHLSLTEADGKRWNGNGPEEALRRSCINVMAAWKYEQRAR